jgi:hypothetical protein
VLREKAKSPDPSSFSKFEWWGKWRRTTSRNTPLFWSPTDNAESSKEVTLHPITSRFGKPYLNKSLF